MFDYVLIFWDEEMKSGIQGLFIYVPALYALWKQNPSIIHVEANSGSGENSIADDLMGDMLTGDSMKVDMLRVTGRVPC